MYGKIFESIYDGTIAVNWKALVTFQQLIVLCESDGTIDMTPPAISRRTNIPLDIIEEGLDYLQKPDPYSRSKAEEGRRIVPLDPERIWGWRIVNHKYYRDLASKEDKREKDRVRIAEKRSKINDVASCRTESQMSPIHIQDTNTISKGTFVPPKLQEVKDYIAEKKLDIDPERFFNHYESVNWFRGKTKIKNWKACMKTWAPTTEKPKPKGKEV